MVGSNSIILQDYIVEKLASTLKAGILEVASSRTMRYLVNNKIKGASIDDDGNVKVEEKDFNKRVDEVARTMVSLRGMSATVTVGGDSYLKSDYKVPTRLIPVIQGLKIYASKDAVSKTAPYYEVVGVSTPLTPEAFNAFFDDFNRTQGNVGTIDVSSYERRDLTLDDIQYVKDENDLLLRIHEEGALGIEACSYLTIRIPSIEEYAVSYEAPSDIALGRWIMNGN